MAAADRLDRIESSLAISQLPSRYAMALDARDLDALVALFVDEVDAGAQGCGREALQRWYDRVLRRFYRSIHLICGHEFDFIDADHATGSVYCRAEHEDGDGWPTDVPLRASMPQRMPSWRAFWEHGDPEQPGRLSRRP
jgi:ketosteroid isomerase-like protein